MTIKGGEAMMKHCCVVIVVSIVSALLLAGVAAAQQFQMLDKIANKVIQKYQTSSCQQLMEEKIENKPKPEMEQKLLYMLHNDPAMRAEFFNRVAVPIATKLFECGMIP